MIKMSTNTQWLLAMADQEDNRSVSVGGLRYTLVQKETRAKEQVTERCALAKLIELRRRQYQLSVEELAAKADVDLEDVLSIEQGADGVPEPRTIHHLAESLKLPERKLMQLAGLVSATDGRFREATVRFAARSEPITVLTPEEHRALEQYVLFLAEA